MIAFRAGMRVWIAGGVTDMRRGMNTLALTVQQGLGRDPYAGEIFCFRGRKGGLVNLLWRDGVGMSLYTERLEAGKFISYGLCQPFQACAINRSIVERHYSDERDPHR